MKENYYTKLDGRKLWIDGDSTLELPFLYSHLLEGNEIKDGMFVSKKTFETDEVKYFNKQFPEEKLNFKEELENINKNWNIPEEYKSIDITDYMKKLLRKECKSKKFSEEEIIERARRVKLELRLWKEKGLLNLLKSLIYIIDVFEENNVVWGTGRGSSCACYTLYLIGLHEVDSIFYELDIGEFFR